MQRDSFVMYGSWAEAIDGLPAEQYKACMQALIAYALRGEDNPDGLSAKMFLTMAKPSVDKNNQRYINGQKGGRPKTEPKPNDNQTETKNKPKAENAEPNVYVYVNDNVNDKEKTKAKEKPFRRPTVDEVREYCTERGNDINAQAFVDFYEAKGWRIGKEPMKDWKACVRTWEQRPRSPAAAKPVNKFSNFEQRKYDYNDLEARLLRAQGG